MVQEPLIVYRAWACNAEEVPHYQSHHRTREGAEAALMAFLELKHERVFGSIAEWSGWYATEFQLDGTNFDIEACEVKE